MSYRRQRGDGQLLWPRRAERILAIAERARIVRPTSTQLTGIFNRADAGTKHIGVEDPVLLGANKLLPVHQQHADVELGLDEQLGHRAGIADFRNAHARERLGIEQPVRRLIVRWPQDRHDAQLHVSETFSAGRSASHRTRAGKQERVRASFKAIGKHDANQSAVWSEVEQSLAQSGAVSPTSALADAYARREADLRQLRESLVLPGDAVGLAVFHGAALQGLDLFDRHVSLRYFRDSLIDSYTIDWLGRPPTIPAGAGAGDVVRQTLEKAAAAKWEPFASPGEGTDYRLDDDALSGSALVWEERTLLHMQLFPRQPADDPDHPATTQPGRPRIHRRYGTRHG